MKHTTSPLWDICYTAVHELETERGILASSETERYGCIFGRDSLISALMLLRTYRNTKDTYFLDFAKKIIGNIALLQGKEINVESGEQPGKCIHEYRETDHEHLTQQGIKPWYVYPDGTMRNYDSIDSTPLFLMALYMYLRESNDTSFATTMAPYAKQSVLWLKNHADTNGDGLIDYQYPERRSGGLLNQGWMDSAKAIFHEDGSNVVSPVALVEVQGYAYSAFLSSAVFFKERDPQLADTCAEYAQVLKKQFNTRFLCGDDTCTTLASGLDGNGKQITPFRSSVGHCLWAFAYSETNKPLCIIDDMYIPQVVESLINEKIFEPCCGIRTLAKDSAQYDPNSYHRGSIWPHDNAITALGMYEFGFSREGNMVQEAIINALTYFGTPLELFISTNGSREEYISPNGHRACRKQAWSATSALALLSHA